MSAASLFALPPRTRILAGAAFLAWGTIGLYVSDRAERELQSEGKEGGLRVMVVEKGDEGWKKE
ncbi:unnamed protein product [Diplocarpon coronariae]